MHREQKKKSEAGKEKQDIHRNRSRNDDTFREEPHRFDKVKQGHTFTGPMLTAMI